MTSAPEAGLGRRLAANTLHAATGRVVAIALWLLLTPAILRAIGAEGYAVWSFFFALTGSLNALDLGLSAATLRNVAAVRARGEGGIAGEYATLGALGYLALGLLWLAITPLLREPVLAFLHVPASVHDAARFAFVAGAAVFALMGLTNVTIAVLQACNRFDLANAVLLGCSIAQVTGILAVLRTGAGLVGILLVTGAAWALAFLGGMLAVRLALPDFHWATPVRSLRRARETLAFGGPMQLSSITGVVHQQVDKVFLARWVAFASVTPYDLALRATTAASTFPQLLLLAMLPAASAIHASEPPARLRVLYDRGNRWVLTATAVIVAAVLAGADLLFVAWLGHAEPAGALALRGLILAAAAAMLTGMATTTARGIGRTDLEAEWSLAAFLVHVVLAFFLVRAYGLRGALVAIVVGNIVGATWLLVRLAGVMGWPRRELLLAPLGVPTVAVLAGVGAGELATLALPLAHGVAAWLEAFAVAAVAAAAVLLAVFALRYLSLDEVRSLLRRTAPGAGATP